MEFTRSWTTRCTLAVSLCVVSSWILLSADLVQCQGGKAEPNVSLAACKGPSCPFRYTCGIFPLNRLKAKPINRTSFAPYIVNGVDIEPGMWPAYVSVTNWLELYPGKDSGASCGGVLITDRHVLTAGHCLGHQRNTSKLAGNGDIFSTVGKHVVLENEGKYIQLMGTKSLCRSRLYSEYNATGMQQGVHDYGIIRLDYEPTLSDYVRPACLPYQHIYSYDQCWMVGEGITKYLKGWFGQVVKQTEYPKIIQMLKVEPYPCDSLGFQADYSRSCWTKSPGQPSKDGQSNGCLGDSGAPILCHQGDSQRWVVVGIVNYGTPTCVPKSTGLFGAPLPPITVAANIKNVLSLIKEDCEI